MKEYPLSGTYMQAAKAYIIKGEKKMAIEAYEKAISLWPENEEALSDVSKMIRVCGPFAGLLFFL